MCVYVSVSLVAISYSTISDLMSTDADDHVGGAVSIGSDVLSLSLSAADELHLVDHPLQITFVHKEASKTVSSSI
jgi:hypothetical protein